MKSLRYPSLVTEALECDLEQFMIPRAKRLLLGMWVVVSYPTAFLLSVCQILLIFQGLAQSFFLLEAFPALSSRKGIPPSAFWEGFVLSYYFLALQSFCGTQEFHFSHEGLHRRNRNMEKSGEKAGL